MRGGRDTFRPWNMPVSDCSDPVAESTEAIAPSSGEFTLSEPAFRFKLRLRSISRQLFTHDARDRHVSAIHSLYARTLAAITSFLGWLLELRAKLMARALVLLARPGQPGAGLRCRLVFQPMVTSTSSQRGGGHGDDLVWGIAVVIVTQRLWSFNSLPAWSRASPEEARLWAGRGDATTIASLDRLNLRSRSDSATRPRPPLLAL
jgi:hypothetical protein